MMTVKQLIIQETAYDCGAACLAMVLGLPTSSSAQFVLGRRIDEDLSDLYEDIGCDGRVGVSGFEMMRVLWEQGIPCCPYFPRDQWGDESESFHAWDKMYLPKPEMVRQHLCRGLGIVMVPSITTPTENHAIVMDHGVVWDPGRAFTERYDRAVDVLDSILFAILIGNPDSVH